MKYPRRLVGELSSIVTKGTTPTTLGKKFAEKGIPFLRIQNLQEGKVVLNEDTLYIDNETDSLLRRSRIQENDVLLSIAGTIGRSAVVDRGLPLLNCNQAIAIIRLNDAVDPSFFRYWLDTPDAQNQIYGSKVTATISNLSLSLIKQLKIPIPPLKEQKRIAAILDKANTIRRKRRQAIQLADEFLRSVFLDMFGDPVSNLKNWDRKPIENTIEDIKPGWSIKGNNRDRKPGEWGVLKISAVTSGHFLPEECKVVATNSIKRGMVKPQKGDLLFTRANTRELVAATCIVERDYDQLFLPDKIWKIIPKQIILRPEFLRFVLSHPRYRDTIRKQATGTSGSMLNVSQTKIKNMIIPVPPLAFQEKFSKIFWKLYHIRNQVDESIQNATVLFNSISQRAFRGEL